MIGSRIEAAVAVVVGLAVVSSYLWFPHLALLFVGAFIAGIGTWTLVGALRRSPTLRKQEAMIRALWSTCRRWPSGLVLRDSVTGSRITVERERGFLNLVITGQPDDDDPADGPAGRRAMTVTRYLLGFLAAPVPPPLFVHTTALHDVSPVRMSWRQAGALLHVNELTGAMEATTEEFAELRAQLDRTIEAATRA